MGNSILKLIRIKKKPGSDITYDGKNTNLHAGLAGAFNFSNAEAQSHDMGHGWQCGTVFHSVSVERGLVDGG